MAEACRCDVEGEWWCPVHVACDEKCRALKEPPDDVGELRKALEHWREHDNLSGCSHGR